MITINSVKAPHARGGRRNSAAIVTGMSTSAVRIRVLIRAAAPESMAIHPWLARRRLDLLAGASEAAFALLVRGDRRIQRDGVEIRPQHVGEIKLGVGELPKQKIGDSLLAAGADEKVRLRRIRHREIRVERL